jgi:hypothetical protein
MQPIQKIAIPEACHQQWQQMTPVDNGRHCQQCCKTVTDFTVMTNTEIINYFAQHGNVCGRFENHQLAGLNNYLAVQEKSRFSWKRLTIAAAVTSVFATANAAAQSTLGKVKVSQSANQVKGEPVVDSITYVTLRGKIISSDDKLPVVGAAVYVKNKSIGTQTDAEGNFRLKVPYNDMQTLAISFIGYQKLEVNSTNFLNTPSTVTLQMSPVVMGDIMIIQKPGFVKRCWNKVKRIF